MNLLLKYYIEKYTVPEWKEKFTSASQKVIMYKFKGTNGRYLTSFDIKFKEFLEVEGIPRSEWPTYENGQLIHKQYTVPMIETRLFYKEDGKYYKTAKGKVFQKYLDVNMSDSEKWLINYLLLLDSTISNKDNYIVKRSNEIQNIFTKNTSEKFSKDAAFKFFEDRNLVQKYEDMAKYDYLYLNCFYLDEEFLRLYINSSVKDREELKQYVYNNLKNRNENCCISKKFISTNYSVPEIIDDVKIYCFSILLNDIKYFDFNSTIKDILDVYKKYYNYNEDMVLDFIEENRDIFESILINVFKVEDLEGEESEEEFGKSIIIESINQEIGIDIPEKRIDDTTIEGKKKLKNIFTVRKKIAREKANYKCELEQYKGCRYFTSKTTKHNYVEVHHFVPKEFRNNYENSIDVLANYITLCPHCHKMIHLAVDRERIDVIRYIFNQRKDRLKSCGLHVELKDLIEYYNIENE